MTILINILGALLFLVLLGIFLLCIELYIHKKIGKKCFNLQGYRGPLVKKKNTNEIRIAILGDCSVYGYLIKPEETMASFLEEILSSEPTPSGKKITVINLGFNSDRAVSFLSTTKKYEYLKPDIALVYSGYSDRIPKCNYRKKEKESFRNKSFIFKMTGYMPILPHAIKESYYKRRYGDVLKGYAVAGKRKEFIERIFKRIFPKKRIESIVSEEIAIKQYIEHIDALISYCLLKGRRFIFVSEPNIYNNEFAKKQQEMLQDFIHLKYRGNNKLLHISLRGIFDHRITNELSKESSFDGMHLTGKFNKILAAVIADSMKPFIYKAIS